MNIQKIAISKIKPAQDNPRIDLKPGDPEYDKLKKVINEFDMVEPIVVNKIGGGYRIIGGHQRYKILKARGDKEVDASVVELDEVKEKALNIALNKTGGDFDFPKLKDILEELDTGDFDIELTGFDDKEIESMMTQIHVEDTETDLKESTKSNECPKCGYIWDYKTKEKNNGR